MQNGKKRTVKTGKDASMHQEQGHLCRAGKINRITAEQGFANPAVAVASGDDHTGAISLCAAQQRQARTATLRFKLA